MADSRLKLKRRLLAAATVVFLVLALRPGSPDGVDSLPISDKLQHFGIFVFFGFLVQAAYPASSTWLKMGVLAAIGLGIELGQLLVPYRYFSGWDLAANCAGIGIFFAVRAVVFKKPAG